jgi:RHS repeat-associated protein
LFYTYYNNSNKLSGVLNHSDDRGGFDNRGFGDIISHFYEYDANGNMVYDHRLTREINYNFLNLPSQITMTQGRETNMIHYTYTTSGQKLSQQLEEEGRSGTLRRYAGPFVVENGELKWVNTPEGRIVEHSDFGTTWVPEFHLKDHLGNTRVALLNFTDDVYLPTQTNHYYPFGMRIAGLSEGSSSNRYLYNDKEFQDDFGLNWYDYGARFYDPQIARFQTVDPLTEKNHRNTPYSYAANNPIRYIDWLGLDTMLVDRRGRFSETVLPDDENDHDVVVRVSRWERRRGRINYNKDGSLRDRHKNFETSKNAFQISRRGAVKDGRKIDGVRLGGFDSPEAAKEIFEALVNITTVEWSYVAKLDEGSNVHINMFTSHQRYSETLGASMALYWHTDKHSPFTVISHIHNHPGSAHDVLMPSPDDIDYRNRLLQDGPLLFGIYNRGLLRGYEFD